MCYKIDDMTRERRMDADLRMTQLAPRTMVYTTEYDPDSLVVYVQYKDPESIHGTQFRPYDLYPLYHVQHLRGLISEDCCVNEEFIFLMRNGTFLEDDEILKPNDLIQALVYYDLSRCKV